MGRRESLHKFRGRLIALAIFYSLVTLLFICTRASSTAVDPEQQRRRPPQRRTTPPASTPATPEPQAKGKYDYAHFQHAYHRPPYADLKCSDCHVIPSPAEPDVIAATKHTDIKGFPYHDSCVRCHRPQFFKGTAPPICTVCHTRSSPHLTAHDMRPFPKFGVQAVTREFPGYFPHGLHQNVIARNERPASNAVWNFLRASFKTSADAPPKEIENCETCHVTDPRPLQEKIVGTINGKEDKFTPAAGTFKTIPGRVYNNLPEETLKNIPTGHASCFNCHWKAQSPTREDCDRCHLSQSDYAKAKGLAASPDAPPGALSRQAGQWFQNWPAEWPKRFSLKFQHGETVGEGNNKKTIGEGNHDLNCTACHTNITRMTTLGIPKADVPITACAYCHVTNNSVAKVGDKVTIFSEMKNRKDNSKYTCVGCHTPLIGSAQPPCSHYRVVGYSPPPDLQCKQ